MMHPVLLALFLGIVGLAHADEPPAPPCPVQVLIGHVECRSAAHPDTRRIFPCPDRARVLQSAGIDKEKLPELFSGIEEEHLRVKAAIEAVAAANSLTGLQKAVYWEELGAILQTQLGHPISVSFRGLYEGQDIYLFQGTKRFEGKAYLLAVLADGSLYTGRVDPIEDIGAWTTRLQELKKIGG